MVTSCSLLESCGLSMVKETDMPRVTGLLFALMLSVVCQCCQQA